MTNSVLNKTEQVLLDLLGNNLFSAGKSLDAVSVDWRLVWYESYLQGVSLTVFADFPQELTESVDFSSMRQKLQSRMTDNLVVNKAHFKIHEILTDVGIPYVILKGLASGLYYPDFILRSMGDVDFLVSSKDLEKTCAVLEQNGFVASEKSHGDHFVYSDGVCRYELHTEPAGMPKGEAGGLVKSYLVDVLEKAERKNTLFGQVVVPSAFHHGIIILLHTCHHLTSSGVGLRHLCDWAVFVNSLSDDEFCDLFKDKFKEIGLWKFACVLTKVCEKYLSCPESKWVGEVDEALVDALAKDIFEGGNLGQKSDDRSHEAMILPKYGDEEHKEKSNSKRFVAYVNQSVKNNWKKAEKNKFLLPIGWVYFGGRYVFRSLKGERPKINVSSFVSEAKQRTELFDSLNLFKNE
jgi:hypothetical protein